jgi:hypothetical protein
MRGSGYNGGGPGPIEPLIDGTILQPGHWWLT